MSAPAGLPDRRALMRTYAEPGVTFVSGSGSWLVDVEGRRYLDFVSGLAVTSLGHAHPEVAAAVCEQAGTGTVRPDFTYRRRTGSLRARTGTTRPPFSISGQTAGA